MSSTYFLRGRIIIVITYFLCALHLRYTDIKKVFNKVH